MVGAGGGDREMEPAFALVKLVLQYRSPLQPYTIH